MHAIAIFAGLQSRESETEGNLSDLLRTIDSNDFPMAGGSRMFLEIPRDLIRQLTTSRRAVRSVRVGSFLYQNVNNLFPDSLPGRNE